MDEALAETALDLSGRGLLVFNVEFRQEKIGTYDVSLTQEFLRAFATNARLTLHVNVRYGEDGHHIVEAIFKALARSLAAAVTLAPGVSDVPSTKGVL
jgi:imidazoleglycerol-phosphate dehydratase